MKTLSIINLALAFVMTCLSGIKSHAGEAAVRSNAFNASPVSSLSVEFSTSPANVINTRPPPPQEPADYNHPPRDYEQRLIRGWTVWVEKELVTRDPELTKKALTQFERKLGEALELLPRNTHTNFQPLSFFILYGKNAAAGGRGNGLEYFTKAAPEHYAYLDPRMGHSIVIYSAENYVSLSEFWALKAVVHKLAHAQQLEQWPEDQPDILNAYRNAMSAKLYRHVRDLDGKVLDEAYATTNQLEYFAEISCSYFVGGHYFPFNREQFKTYDPAGFSLVRKLWRLDE